MCWISVVLNKLWYVCFAGVIVLFNSYTFSYLRYLWVSEMLTYTYFNTFQHDIPGTNVLGTGHCLFEEGGGGGEFPALQNLLK